MSSLSKIKIFIRLNKSDFFIHFIPKKFVKNFFILVFCLKNFVFQKKVRQKIRQAVVVTKHVVSVNIFLSNFQKKS